MWEHGWRDCIASKTINTIRIGTMKTVPAPGGTARGDHRGHSGAVPDQAEEPVCSQSQHRMRTLCHAT